MPDNSLITLIYDLDLLRPGCALIQAVGGGDSLALQEYFDAEDWLVSPTPGMRTMRGTPAQWASAAKITRENRNARG